MGHSRSLEERLPVTRDSGWISSDGPRPRWWLYLAILLPVPLALLIEVVWLLGPRAVLDRLAFHPVTDVQGIVIVWTLWVAVPIIALVITLNLRNQSIRVNDSGVEVKSLLWRRQVGWDEFRWLSPIVKDRVALTYYQSGRLFGSHGWLMDLTRHQAAALLGHPNMPQSLLTPKHLAWANG